MFQKILLATDGSSHANRAAAAALELAGHVNDTTVILVHVSPSVPRRDRLIRARFDVKGLLEEDAHHDIIQTEYKLRNAGISYELKVALGDPAKEIVRIAEEEECQLIIVGSRGLNKLSEVLLGSVSHEVAHKAKIPVMIVK